MYISKLLLWNFRKYKCETGDIDLTKPGLTVNFSKGLNVLIGENDSGKTAIIDAIKLVVRTHSAERIRVEYEDFSIGTFELRIEVLIDGLTVEECAKFNGVLEFEEGHHVLNLALQATIGDTRILPYETKALIGGQEHQLNAIQKDYLHITYLKPLRDADNELTAHRGSRMSQILLGHKLFADGANGKMFFEDTFKEANEKIDNWFDGKDNNQDEDVQDREDSQGQQIKDVIDGFVHDFIDDEHDSELTVADNNIRSILEKISISIANSQNMGLGTMNRLYMATELLHLNHGNEEVALRTCLIEELEAHLHPQAQLKIIEKLQKEKDVQFILTTHSPNLASKIRMNAEGTSVILCKDKDVYPLTKGKTMLDDKDYVFLDHFLDVTKANLFFARGVILVEGWAEELLIPVIAEKIGYSLTKHEVSLVNIASTAFLHYARILMRKDGKQLQYPVAVVTDTDIKPNGDFSFDNEAEIQKQAKIKEKVGSANNVEIFFAYHWTLEWCLYESNALGTMFKQGCHKAHPKTDDFKPKNEDETEWDENKFKIKLKQKLDRSDAKSTDLNKVAVANILAQKIAKLPSLSIQSNDTAYYLVQAIKHACGKNL